MVTYEKYAETATKNGFTIMPENEWSKMVNMIKRHKAYFSVHDKIDNLKIENLLLEVEGAQIVRPI